MFSSSVLALALQQPLRTPTPRTTLYILDAFIRYAGILVRSYSAIDRSLACFGPFVTLLCP